MINDLLTEFSELMSNCILESLIIVYKICFSDKFSFTLIGVVNKQNFKIGPMKTLIYTVNNILKHLVNENLTGVEIYCDLLQNAISPVIIRVAQEEENLIG